MIPVPLISLALSLFTKTDKEKIPEIAEGIKQRAFNKTNSAAYAGMMFSIAQLTQNSDDHFYQGAFLFCIFMATARDTAHKVIVALKELKTSHK